MIQTPFCIEKESSGVSYIQFNRWKDKPHLICGFTTKKGGVSQGQYSTLNLGFNVGDEEVRVRENYERLAKALGLSINHLVCSRQVHETQIEKATYEDCGNGIFRPNKWQSADGLYTTEPNLALITYYADCVPLFFYAEGYNIIGMAHAGWRGTVKGIGREMIKLWTEKENIPIEAIEVVIGPSIGSCCFEVHEDVASVFSETFPKQQIVVENAIKGKYNINLWEANRHILIEAGVLPQNIEIAGVCTCCENETFFSHRYTKGKRGTLAGVMCLKK